MEVCEGFIKGIVLSDQKEHAALVTPKTELNPTLPLVKLCCVAQGRNTLQYVAVHCLVHIDPGFLLLWFKRWVKLCAIHHRQFITDTAFSRS